MSIIKGRPGQWLKVKLQFPTLTFKKMSHNHATLTWFNVVDFEPFYVGRADG